jgi:hypothetical protein
VIDCAAPNGDHDALHARLRRVGNHGWPVEMVGVDEVKHRAGGVDGVDDADRHVVEPDVFAQGNPGAVGLQHDMAGRIVIILRRRGGVGEVGDALHEAPQAVIGVSAIRRVGSRPVLHADQIAMAVILFGDGERAGCVADAIAPRRRKYLIILERN